MIRTGIGDDSQDAGPRGKSSAEAKRRSRSKRLRSVSKCTARRPESGKAADEVKEELNSESQNDGGESRERRAISRSTKITLREWNILSDTGFTELMRRQTSAGKLIL